MINNYIEHEYKPCHCVYTHESSGKNLYLGDIQAALDIEFINREQIKTGNECPT